MSPEKEGSGSIAKDVELVADAKGTSCLSYVPRCLLPPEKPRSENESGQNGNLKTVAKSA